MPQFHSSNIHPIKLSFQTSHPKKKNMNLMCKVWIQFTTIRGQTYRKNVIHNKIENKKTWLLHFDPKRDKTGLVGGFYVIFLKLCLNRLMLMIIMTGTTFQYKLAFFIFSIDFFKLLLNSLVCTILGGLSGIPHFQFSDIPPYKTTNQLSNVSLQFTTIRGNSDVIAERKVH